MPTSKTCRPPYDTPIMDCFLDAGVDAITTLTNFSLSELNIPWGVCEEYVNEAWYEGLDRANLASSKDAFFMMLCVLKHFDTWEKHALDFRFRTSTFEKLIMRIITLVEPILSDSKKFRINDEALYATDAKFQPAHRPTRSFADAKRYFSAKHKLYGFKIEASVAPPGVYVLVFGHCHGSVSDLTIFVYRLELHRDRLRGSTM
ncbi:hypothetical protein LEN26_017163 [Aphanomyces euteiches]|nr:hypothetical protein LEN26_017163 [Aphanomyces euteiches]KAH9106084.1 hypothetical protein AeMF1_018214 [Aphanomyces euteiches]KAH9120240.1 hypothetical protein AeMF1_007496 [Aphanomyces euteiches]